MTNLSSFRTDKRVDRYDIAAWIIAAGLLVTVLVFHLLPALLAGLLVYELVHILAPKLKLIKGHDLAKIAAVTIIAVGVITLLSAIVIGLLAFLRSDSASLPELLKKMAEILETARTALPPWAAERLPADAKVLQDQSTQWLREHAVQLQLFGKEVGRTFAHVLVGMVIGGILSLYDVKTDHNPKPLARALSERVSRLGDSFRRVVFAQARISAINTIFTAIYLVGVLPVLGVHLPFAKTIIAITFVAGLMPVIGNLISNTVIVIVSLSHSIYVAGSSLIFLIVIHKLEYFLNSKIIGSHINARVWELLVAMLLMEAIFGVPGLIATPIYYAYMKSELKSKGLV